MKAFLASLGLEKYHDTFVEAEVDLDTLPLLDEDDLKELDLPLGPRRKLMNAIRAMRPESTAPKGPSEPIAADIASAERRHMTVIFVELANGTNMMAGRDPETVRDILTRYHKTVAEAVARFDGHVAQYFTDGILCYFGWPRTHENDAERAVRAGLDMARAVNRIDAGEIGTLRTRIGIATGVVVVGDLLKDAETQEAVISGDTPNLAARLQELAAPDQIVISPNTRAILGEMFELQDMRARSLKGIATPIRASAVSSERAMESRFATRSAGKLSDIVGRENEISQIENRWHGALSGQGQLLLVSGEAGIGKSRIVQEFVDTLKGQTYQRVTCQCSPYHTENPFYPFIQALTRAAQFETTDTDAERLARLEAVPGMTGGDLPLFASLLDIDPRPRFDLPDTTPTKLRSQLLDALVRLTLAQSDTSPLLVVFEDLHWIDPTSLELIELLLEQMGTHQILFLSTARPEFGDRVSDHPNVKQLFLNRLGPSQINQMVSELAGKKPVSPGLIHTIAHRTDGVPLFVEELTKSLLESDNLVEQGGQLVMAASASDTSIPNTLHDSLMARLERKPHLKDVAQLASCIGREFEFDVLNEISALREQDLRDALLGLIDAELVYRRGVVPNERFLFKHALVRDAAYDSLLKERRRSLHASLLETLEAGGDVSFDVLARHADAAGQEDRALELWEAASQVALARPAVEEAISHLNRAIAIVRPKIATEDPDYLEKALRLQVALSVATLTRWGYGSDDTRRAFEYALSLSDRIDRPALRFAVQYGLWVGEYVRAEYEPALSRAQLMVEQASGSSESEHLVLAHRLVGVNLCLTGRLEQARDSLQKSIALFDPDTHSGLADRYGQDICVATHCYLMYCQGLMGDHSSAESHGQSALERAEKLTHANTSGYVFAHLGFYALMRNDRDTLQHYCSKLNAVAQEHDLSLWKDTGAAFAAILSIGQTGAAGISDFLEADAKYRSKNALAQLPILRVRCAEQAILAGEFDAARTIAASAKSLMISHGEAYPMAELHRIEATLSHGAGDIDEARGHLQSALSVARSQGAVLWERNAQRAFDKFESTHA